MGTTVGRVAAAAIVSIFGWTTSAHAAPSAAVGIISTFAGTGVSSSTGDGGPATAATLRTPYGMAVDAIGNVYISEQQSQRVRKVVAATGVITTVAGTGTSGFSGDGGLATSATLTSPSGIAVNAAGDLFIADQFNQRVRKVAAATGIITTIAGTGTAGFNGDGISATSAQLQNPSSVAVDGAGNIYISDTQNNRVRKVSAASGVITSVAGPILSGVDVLTPRGIALRDAHTLYVFETLRLLRIDLSTNTTTIEAAGFFGLTGTGVDRSGNLYLSDGQRVRRLDAVTGLVTTVAGNGTSSPVPEGAEATASGMSGPRDIAIDANGNLFIADVNSARVRKVTTPVPTYFMTTSAGTGTSGYNGEGSATASALAHPSGIVADAVGNVYIGDSFNHRIRKVTPAGEISTIAGTGIAAFGGDNGPATAAQLYHPEGLAFDRAGNLFVADAANQRIRKISTAGIITTVAGNGVAGLEGDGGPATSAKLYFPTAVAVDAGGNLFIADLYNNIVRKVDAISGVITTVAGTVTAGFSGDGGAATAARLNKPRGLALDGSGNLYISDSLNARIRKVDATTGVITTFAGGGNFNVDNVAATSVGLSTPGGLTFDVAGNLFVAESSRVRRISRSTTVATIVAGGSAGFCASSLPALCDDNGPATAAHLNNVYAVAIDASGNLQIADYGGDRVRTASPPILSPINLTLSRYGSGAILNWTSPAGATAFVVKRGTNSGTETALVTVATNTAYITGTPGTRYFFVVSALFGSSESANSNEVSLYLSSPGSRNDIDGDRRSDVLVYRPGTGYWYSLNSASGYVPGAGASTFSWGAAGDIPVQADFDGDGKLDPTVYRPSTGQWFAALSTRGYDASAFLYAEWGAAGDMPLTGDFDGDGKSDIAVYRPTTGDWYIRLSSTGYVVGAGYPTYIRWGGAGGSVPIVADFDADGKADLAVYISGAWWIVYSSLGYNVLLPGAYSWGTTGDQSLVADFDGDGRADIGVYRPSNGYWYLRLSAQNYTPGAGNWIFQWGAPGDEPKLGDFDGDGLVDITVYRPSTGQWFIRYSSLGYDISQFGYFEWGAPGDLALP